MRRSGVEPADGRPHTGAGDDLAAGLGVAPPAFPAAGLDTVMGVLCAMAARRYGTNAVIRALSRAERAPATIAAL
ncbi:hypothetical protein [Paractinoplanes toevensis]|uniref:Uncharacterized protein n=1 Tax=Paractinoplanes toevensis TaxID=571911 RepID=A0A919WAJ0_9ACTN|nr:hypothetical protein [Actinoplanes toevensis]GIM96620.1 hypothetical protein Ato02nite_084130 [Actinoplanes toevensis]